MRRVAESTSSATYSLHAQRLVPGAVLGNPHYQGAIYLGKGHALKIMELEEQALFKGRIQSKEKTLHESALKQAC